MEKAERLQVTRGDFLTSLENDIKPVSGGFLSNADIEPHGPSIMNTIKKKKK